MCNSKLLLPKFQSSHRKFKKQTALTGFGNEIGLDNIPASAIRRIEVINNPSAKYDANGNTGIINLWGDHYDMADSYDAKYVHIMNLRKKLTRHCETEYIKTLQGMGYKWKS